MSKRVNRNRPKSAPPPLPPLVEAAWGLQERTEKGPRPSLTLRQVVAGAVAVAGAEGLDAVSMSRVAQELSVATMSLYRYVRSKEELLTLMVDSVFIDAPETPRPKETWRTALSRWAYSHLLVLRQNPWVVRVPISGPPLTPNHVIWFERGIAAMRGMPDYGAMLARLIDPQRFPALTAVLEAGVFRFVDAPPDPDEEFRFGLQRILDGVETLLRSQR